MNEITKAVRDHTVVRVDSKSPTAPGFTGVAMEYDDVFDAVKIGRVDRMGVYSGESVTVPAHMVKVPSAAEYASKLARVRGFAWTALTNSFVLAATAIAVRIQGGHSGYVTYCLTFSAVSIAGFTYSLFRITRK